MKFYFIQILSIDDTSFLNNLEEGDIIKCSLIKIDFNQIELNERNFLNRKFLFLDLKEIL